MSVSVDDVWFGKSGPIDLRLKDQGFGLRVGNVIAQLAVQPNLQGPTTVTTGSINHHRQIFPA